VIVCVTGPAPVNSSVIAEGPTPPTSPPIAKPACVVPAPAGNVLAVDKLVTVVQVEPSYSSVAFSVVPVSPPKAKAAV
jgi:hypothetical protein